MASGKMGAPASRPSAARAAEALPSGGDEAAKVGALARGDGGAGRGADGVHPGAVHGGITEAQPLDLLAHARRRRGDAAPEDVEDEAGGQCDAIGVRAAVRCELVLERTAVDARRHVDAAPPALHARVRLARVVEDGAADLGRAEVLASADARDAQRGHEHRRARIRGPA